MSFFSTAEPAECSLGLACACCRWGVRLAEAAAATARRRRHMLVLGRISDDPWHHYEQLKPLLLDYMVPRMAGVGIRSGHPWREPAADDQLPAPRPGGLGHETAGNAAMLERARRQALLPTERRADPLRTCSSSGDGPVQTLTDLAGQHRGFQNTYSTSAYFLPAMARLLDEGMKSLLSLSPMGSRCRTVGYLFAGTERNITTGAQGTGRCRAVSNPTGTIATGCRPRSAGPASSTRTEDIRAR